MKKLLFIAALFIMSAAAYAQTSYTFNNYSNCAVSIQVLQANCSTGSPACIPTGPVLTSFIVNSHTTGSSSPVISPTGCVVFRVCWVGCPSVCTDVFSDIGCRKGAADLPGCSNGGCMPSQIEATGPNTFDID